MEAFKEGYRFLEPQNVIDKSLTACIALIKIDIFRTLLSGESTESVGGSLYSKILQLPIKLVKK